MAASKFGALCGLALACLLAAGVGAGAVEIVTTMPGAMSQNDAGDLQALQNRIQRQQYQQQQQQFRLEDRLSIPSQQPSPQVPIVKPSCQAKAYGSRVVRDCR